MLPYRDGSFSGPSAATPITAGAFGLLFQMWHEEVFAGFGGGASVFADRPHFSTAKAMMINTAFRYGWNLPGATPENAELTRPRQGWGIPNLHDDDGFGLYDLADRMLIINEAVDMTYAGQIKAYHVTAIGSEPLRVTLVYPDPAAATSASVQRVNDLSVRVTDAEGTRFWGNDALAIGNWCIGVDTEDHINTVENVFVEKPLPYVYVIQVFLTELNADGNPETAVLTDVDFALVVSGIVTGGMSIGDFNNDDTVNSDDFAAFVDAFLRGKADIDRDGETASDDLFLFLDLLFSYRTTPGKEAHDVSHP
jgi:serine protease AprX